jgi:N,N'-diacetyllegionaminate synthase
MAAGARKPLRSESREISLEGPPYLIAEIGLNHNGDAELAKRMIDAAAENGAHAAKFQLFQADAFINPRAKLGEGAPGSLAAFFEQFELKPDEWRVIADHSRQAGLDFFCSVFDAPSFELYRDLGATLLKIASSDLNNQQLLETAAAGPWGLLISAGASNESEVERTVGWLPADAPLLLFECVSHYPAEPDEYNLSVLPRWREKFGVQTGLSDHCPANLVSFAAVALGAAAIEKHFTLSHDLPGPDQKLSATPEQFRELADGARALFLARRDRPRVPAESEAPVRRYGRRALYAARRIPAGTPLSAEDLIAARPGGAGPGADQRSAILGRTFAHDLQAGDPIPE